jgi:hypothetical protein
MPRSDFFALSRAALAGPTGGTAGIEPPQPSNVLESRVRLAGTFRGPGVTRVIHQPITGLRQHTSVERWITITPTEGAPEPLAIVHD